MCTALLAGALSAGQPSWICGSTRQSGARRRMQSAKTKPKSRRESDLIASYAAPCKNIFFLILKFWVNLHFSGGQAEGSTHRAWRSRGDLALRSSCDGGFGIRKHWVLPDLPVCHLRVIPLYRKKPYNCRALPAAGPGMQMKGEPVIRGLERAIWSSTKTPRLHLFQYFFDSYLNEPLLFMLKRFSISAQETCRP